MGEDDQRIWALDYGIIFSSVNGSRGLRLGYRGAGFIPREALLPAIVDKPQDEMRLIVGMLVRAYDPCISCSIDLLEVEFK